MITVPKYGRFTLLKAFELLGELDWLAGSRSGSGSSPLTAVEKARTALREHIAASLQRKDKRGAK